MKNSANLTELNGKNPNSLAASAIYLAMWLSDFKSSRSKKEIADICGSTETTLNSTFKIMQKNQQNLLN